MASSSHRASRSRPRNSPALAVAPGDLGAAVARLAGDPGRARDMGGRARALLRDRAGDPAALVARILDLAHPSG